VKRGWERFQGRGVSGWGHNGTPLTFQKAEDAREKGIEEKTKAAYVFAERPLFRKDSGRKKKLVRRTLERKKDSANQKETLMAVTSRGAHGKSKARKRVKTRGRDVLRVLREGFYCYKRLGKGEREKKKQKVNEKKEYRWNSRKVFIFNG